MKVVITNIQDYSDDRGNSISCASRIESGVKVIFSGSNNRILIHPEAKLRNVNVMFDCDNGYCEIGRNSFSGTIRIGLDCSVFIGSGVTCTSPSYISTAERSKVKLGDDVMVASQVEIRADDAHPIFDVASRKRINLPKDILIENHVWLGAFSVVLGGSIIKSGSVVGIGSIVKSKVPNNCIVAGVPAKVVRKNVAWERPHLTLSKPFYKDDPGEIPLTPYWNMTVEENDVSVDYLKTKPSLFNRLLGFMKSWQ